MAILKGGIHGDVSGKIGGVVAYQMFGKTVLRSKGISKKPKTEKQLAQMQRVKVAGSFISGVLAYVNVGFRLKAAEKNMYPYNVGVSYTMKHALKGVYPNLEIDYAQVRLSAGNLIMANDVEAQLVENGLLFTWNPYTEEKFCNSGDRVMLMAWFPEKKKAVFMAEGAERWTAEQLLVLPQYLRGQAMEVYISFVAKNRKQVSDSLYLGHF